MKKLVLTVAILLMANCLKAQTLSENGPTMGWSSWNTYGFNISETIIKKQADAMVDNGFTDVGYKYLNIDDGFFGGRDADGHLLIHPTRFPNGMKTVVDYIHGKGMKAGIYSDGGENTCASYFGGDTIGIGVGFYGHDEEDAQLYFGELGFDFIKVDFCGGSPYHNKDKRDLPEEERYRAIWNAIQKTGRTDVRMNVCRWAYPGTWVNEVGTSWRTTGDIYCNWNSIKSILKENFYLSAYSSEGKYNDMDMLEVGRGMSTEEDKTHFGMWCMMNSPLLIGCDVSTISKTAKSLLCNTELIALNQDTLFQQAHVVKRSGETYILVKDIEQRNSGIRAMALVNLSDATKVMKVDFADLDLGGTVKMRDLFMKKNLADKTGTYSVSVPAHGTRIYRLEAEERYEQTLYEAESAYITAYQELTNNETAPSGIYSENNACSGGAKAGWLGKKSTNDLIWKNVYSKEGGNYTVTIDYITGENRYVIAEVNGKRIDRFKVNSGDWNTIGSFTFSTELQPGYNTVRLYYSAGWMPDIDCMKLQYDSPLSIKSTSTHAKSGKAYDLNGMEVKDTENVHGIYIQDGKKQLRK